MISDTLSDAANEIQGYLEEYPETYAPYADKIKACILKMHNLRILLDLQPEDAAHKVLAEREMHETQARHNNPSAKW